MSRGEGAAIAAQPRGAAVTARRGEKKSQTLARQILRDVLARRLRPGTTLPPEALMLEEYQVGRTTLREALRILEVQGLLTIRPGPGGGPVLAEAGSRGYARTSSLFFQAGGMRLIEVMEARRVMEPVMARIAAERRDPGGLRRLQLAVEQVESCVDAPAARWREATRQFREAMDETAGQAVPALFCRALDEVVSDRITGFALPVNRRPEAAARLAAVARAIARGNAAAAERLMCEHMDDVNRHAAEGRRGGVRSVVAWG